MASRRVALLALCAVLGSCGFRPLLKPEGDAPAGVREELAAVEVPSLTGRVGYLVRDGLLDQLNPAGVEVPGRYRLSIRLGERSSALGIQLNNTITRYNLTLTARFSLVEVGTGRTVYRAVVRRVASYNAQRAVFAEFSAQQDAERRAAREVSNDIRTQLAIHFARQAEAEAEGEAGPPPTEAAPS
jgi:LPS-assembly lipoprotein